MRRVVLIVLSFSILVMTGCSSLGQKSESTPHPGHPGHEYHY